MGCSFLVCVLVLVASLLPTNGLVVQLDSENFDQVSLPYAVERGVGLCYYLFFVCCSM